MSPTAQRTFAVQYVESLVMNKQERNNPARPELPLADAAVA